MASCTLCDFEAEDGEVRSAEDRVSDHINHAHPDAEYCGACAEWSEYGFVGDCSDCDGPPPHKLCDDCDTKSCDGCHQVWHSDCAPDFGTFNGDETCEFCIIELRGHLNDHFNAQNEHGHGGWENA